MEPKNNQAECRLAPLQKVTPLSKYLTLALFIIMPFIGGWVGYTYAPEKVVETERVVNKEVASDSSELALLDDVSEELSSQEKGDKGEQKITNNDWEASYSTLTTIATQKLNYPEKDYLDTRDFTFNNTVYKVFFQYGRGINLEHNDLSDYANNLDGGSFDVSFGSEVFSLYVHSENGNFCMWGLCQLSQKEMIKLGQYQWEYLGSHKYCDVGECAKFDFVYRYRFGGYVAYIIAHNPIHEYMNSDQKEIVDSLELTLLR